MQLNGITLSTTFCESSAYHRAKVCRKVQKSTICVLSLLPTRDLSKLTADLKAKCFGLLFGVVRFGCAVCLLRRSGAALQKIAAAVVRQSKRASGNREAERFSNIRR